MKLYLLYYFTSSDVGYNKFIRIAAIGETVVVWSYILDYENSQNQFRERREQIIKWRTYSDKDIEESEEVLNISSMIMKHGIKKIDSLHLACAIKANTDYFLTTDDGIIKFVRKNLNWKRKRRRLNTE